MAGHEGVLGDAGRLPIALTGSASEPFHVHSRGQYGDGRGDSALLQERQYRVAGRDDVVAQVGVAGGKIDHEALERVGFVGDVMGVFLVKGMMGEDQRNPAAGGDPEGGIP